MWFAQGHPASTDTFLTPSSVFWLHHSTACFYCLVDSICKGRCPILKIFPLWCSIIAHIICSKKNSTVIYTDPRESSVPYSMNSDCHQVLSTHLLKYQFHSFPSHSHHHSRKCFWKAEFLNSESNCSCGCMKSKQLVDSVEGDINHIIWGHRVNHFLTVEFLLFNCL